MPEIFRCDACKKWQESAGQGQVLTCRHCRTANPRRLLQFSAAIRADGIVCPHCGAGLPPISGAAVCSSCNKALTATGAALEVTLPAQYGSAVRSYEQRALIDGMSDKEVQVFGVKDGMCHGACLDWIRRVLQAGSADYGQAQPVYLARKAAVAELLRTKTDDWNSLAPKLDAYHRQVHGKEHGGRDTRRPFSGIRLASSRARQKAPDLDEAVSALLARELARGGCAIFGVSKDSADQGHAVAIERRTAGDFHLFDPNIGIYAIASEDKLKGAIRWLFETKYGMTGSTRECDWEVYNLAR